MRWSPFCFFILSFLVHAVTVSGAPLKVNTKKLRASDVRKKAVQLANSVHPNAPFSNHPGKEADHLLELQQIKHVLGQKNIPDHLHSGCIHHIKAAVNHASNIALIDKSTNRSKGKAVGAYIAHGTTHFTAADKAHIINNAGRIQTVANNVDTILNSDHCGNVGGTSLADHAQGMIQIAHT